MIKEYLKSGTLFRKFVDYFHFMYLAFANHIVSKIPSYHIRKIIYKYIYFIKIGKNSNIQMGVRFYAPWKLKIGNDCSIGYNSLFDCRRGIVIGNNVDIAGEVRIITLGHDLNDINYKTKGASVIIHDNVSIFIGASILPGRVLAEGTVIALGSVVTKDTEQWCIYGGNPAIKIGKRKIKSLTSQGNYRRYFH